MGLNSAIACGLAALCASGSLFLPEPWRAMLQGAGGLLVGSGGYTVLRAIRGRRLAGFDRQTGIVTLLPRRRYRPPTGDGIVWCPGCWPERWPLEPPADLGTAIWCCGRCGWRGTRDAAADALPPADVFEANTRLMRAAGIARCQVVVLPTPRVRDEMEDAARHLGISPERIEAFFWQQGRLPTTLAELREFLDA